jgi:hypothetical protein
MMRSIAVLAVCAASACTHDSGPTFNPLPSANPVTRPDATGTTPTEVGGSSSTAPAFSPPPEPHFDNPGGSSLQITGTLTARVTADFSCTAASDDYFVRGLFEFGDGYRLAISVNVEHYKGPGRYDREVQLLIRRLRGTTYYASWHTATASGQVVAAGGGLDLLPVRLPAEEGSDATGELTVRGHFGCSR